MDCLILLLHTVSFTIVALIFVVHACSRADGYENINQN